jgi:hypothetical protein
MAASHWVSAHRKAVSLPLKRPCRFPGHRRARPSELCGRRERRVHEHSQGADDKTRLPVFVADDRTVAQRRTFSAEDWRAALQAPAQPFEVLMVRAKALCRVTLTPVLLALSGCRLARRRALRVVLLNRRHCVFMTDVSLEIEIAPPLVRRSFILKSSSCPSRGRGIDS